MSADTRTANTVLVTGATGLVGSELVGLLLAEEFNVRIFRRKTSSLEALGELSNHVEHITGDLTEPLSVSAAMEGVDAVLHLAAQIIGAPADVMHRVNVQGTAHVVDAALENGVSRMVHTSSISALGRPRGGDALIDESTDWTSTANRSPYARSKYQAELEIFRGIAEGLDAVIVNPGFIFGVGRAGENTRRIVDIVRTGWAKAAPSGGTCFVDARDVADGILRALRLGDSGERYILGSENLTWKEAITILADAFGQKPPTFTIPGSLALAVAGAVETASVLTPMNPLVTRSTARTMSSVHRYTNEKAKSELGATFRPFTETAAYISQSLD